MTCQRESKKGSDVEKENAWLIPLQYVRIAINQEVEENENEDIKKNLKISNKVMKKIMSGGDTLKARQLYKDPFDFTTDVTLCAFGNNELSISGSDSSEHHFKFQGVKQFITQDKYDEYSKSGYGEDFMSSYAVRDETLKDLVKTDDYGNAMVCLLLENFTDKSLTIKNESDDSQDVSVRKLIFMNYEITKNEKDKVAKDDLFELLQVDKKKITAELKQIGCVGDCNCKTTVVIGESDGKKITKQVQTFKGLKLKMKNIEPEN